MADEKEPTVLDMRSGRGNKKSAEQAPPQNPAAPFFGPQVTLTFANEYEFDIWRSGILGEGKQALAQAVLRRIAGATDADYDKLVLEVGTIRGGEVANPIALQNAIRRFLDMPEIAQEG